MLRYDLGSLTLKVLEDIVRGAERARRLDGGEDKVEVALRLRKVISLVLNCGWMSSA